MDRAQLQHLAQADRHMAELKAHIGRQRLILARTLAEYRRLLVAKSTLQALEGSLHKFGEHCELILDQLSAHRQSKGSAPPGSALGGSVMNSRRFIRLPRRRAAISKLES